MEEEAMRNQIRTAAQKPMKEGLEHATAGNSLSVVDTETEDFNSVINRIEKSDKGVYVQASTLGSLEALLEFLKSPAVNVPVSGISLGPVQKQDITRAAVMLEKKEEFATILAFDVEVSQEAWELADDLGVKIFKSDIIVHLFDQFKFYFDLEENTVFPCVVEILPKCVFNKKDPIILGVKVTDGILKVGTPICVPDKNFIDIGRIAAIENSHEVVEYAKKGQIVAIKIVNDGPEEQQRMYGRDFEGGDLLVSRVSRRSIDLLKANHRDDLSMDGWKLIGKLKIMFEIQ